MSSAFEGNSHQTSTKDRLHLRRIRRCYHAVGLLGTMAMRYDLHCHEATAGVNDVLVTRLCISKPSKRPEMGLPWPKLAHMLSSS